MKKILVVHGPNLNLLGEREVGIYGRVSMKEINTLIRETAKKLGVSVKIVQTNHEGQIVDLIQKARKKFQGLVINPAAYTHTSVALRDVLLGCGLPAVEVHLSNIYGREEFRQRSLTAGACVGQICGFGKESYALGLTALRSWLDR